MSFLPIVQRELRVAARRKGTFRVRWWTTILALLVSLFSLLTVEVSAPGPNTGTVLFTLLAWYAFGLCLSAGVLLTADSLSAEKRQGTLGLLFLSDLRGYDVVLGKLLARGLSAFYGLVALLPAFALALLLGGVTGGQFWRTALALSDALFLSLAAGLLASALGKEAQQTIANTLMLLLLLVGLLPLVAGLAAKVQPSAVWPALASFSPVYPFIYAQELKYRVHPNRFWISLGCSALAACLCLLWASRRLPALWQERPGRLAAIRTPARERRRAAILSTRTRTALLVRNPIEWLTRMQLGIPWAAWAIVLTWGVVVLIALALGPATAGSPIISGYLIVPFAFLFKLFFALQATRFFVEFRRSGALEMLLATPLTSREILRGQALALRQILLWPVGAFLGFLFFPQILSLAGGLFHQQPDGSVAALSNLFLAALVALRLGMDLLALTAFGMALALTSRRPGWAPALTVLFVLILPSLFWFCGLDIFGDLALIAWAYAQLRQDLRHVLAREYDASLSRPTFRTQAAPTAVPPLIAP